MEEKVFLEKEEKGGRWVVERDGNQQAEMTFVHAGPDKIIIDHTEVKEGNNGKGYGKLLFIEMVNMARSQGLKVIPLCPFALSMFKKNEEYGDVWDGVNNK